MDYGISGATTRLEGKLVQQFGRRIVGCNQRPTIIFSAILLTWGRVNDVGRKSEKLAGLVTFGRGITNAFSQ